MMLNSARPFLALYVVWHPSFAEGLSMAQILYDHYRRKLYENVAGGTGLSVVFRSQSAPDSVVPIDIDLEEAETSAVVVLVNEDLARDANWVAYVRNLLERTEAHGLGSRVFPVAIDGAATNLGIEEQMIRWNRWAGVPPEERSRRLVAGLTYQFCRMLRHYLDPTPELVPV